MSPLPPRDGAVYVRAIQVRRQGLAQRLKDTESRRRHATAALESLDDQTRRLNRDDRIGTISASSYEEDRREIEAERVQLKAHISDLEGQEQALTRQMHEHRALDDVFRLASKWKELDVPARKVVLRHVLDKVIASRSRGTRDEQHGMEDSWAIG